MKTATAAALSVLALAAAKYVDAFVVLPPAQQASRSTFGRLNAKMPSVMVANEDVAAVPAAPEGEPLKEAAAVVTEAKKEEVVMEAKPAVIEETAAAAPEEPKVIEAVAPAKDEVVEATPADAPVMKEEPIVEVKAAPSAPEPVAAVEPEPVKTPEPEPVQVEVVAAKAPEPVVEPVVQVEVAAAPPAPPVMEAPVLEATTADLKVAAVEEVVMKPMMAVAAPEPAVVVETFSAKAAVAEAAAPSLLDTYQSLVDAISSTL